MRRCHLAGHESEFLDQPKPEAGIFSWDIATDRRYADALVAESFGLSAAHTELGLPQETYLARVHPDDIAQVAEANRQAMETAEPYQVPYRVKRSDGSWAEVIAFGLCFYSPSGQPSHFSGIVYPVPVGDRNPVSVTWHLLAAYEIARRDDEAVQARLILDLLVELSLQEKPRKKMQSLS